MEIRKKEKTLAGLFLKYAALFCVNTILLTAGVFMMMLCAAEAGFLLPANYGELQLSENAELIREAGDGVGQWIPKGCTYGIYNEKGMWIKGDFSRQEQKKAWAHYEKSSIYAEYKGYYRFIPQNNGNVCIVKYYLIMRYASDWLNGLLPLPEVLMPILDVMLLILNAVLLSRGFARRMKPQLLELRLITEKICENNLEFETKTSDIKEINEVMASFGRMKDTLQVSLKAQWDMEKQRQEQLSALTHDIKTPLTIIRGNAELLKEHVWQEEHYERVRHAQTCAEYVPECAEDVQDCVDYILTNADEIENYLDTMKQMINIKGQETKREQAVYSCESLAETIIKTAKAIAAAEKLPVSFSVRPPQGVVCCNKEDILRAWSNILSNAAEWTDKERGIEISVETQCRENQLYLLAFVRDYGAGFSERDLQYADKEFYSGDISRHDRRHSGLGLSIAKKFVKAQGGFLEYGNCTDGVGARVAVGLRISCHNNIF